MSIKWEPASKEELERRGKILVRAHNADGTFRADDPVTPENEAWVAKAPAKKPRKSRKKE